MKFKGSGSKGTRVIERKRSVTDGQTDRRTDGQTDKAKTIMSPPEGGGDINIWIIDKETTRIAPFSYHVHVR